MDVKLEDHNVVFSLAKRMGFTELTDLQKKVFENGNFYEFNKWLFIIGATGSGKTLIPLLYFFKEYELNKQNNKLFRMLFVVPYRALAAQKQIEIKQLACKLSLDLKIVQSTGEYKNEDNDIINGNVDIAVIIYEKVYMFASMNSNFIQKYDVLVMDEIGLTQDMERGIKADFILAKAKSISTIRVIALATPFYNWKQYIESFQFFKIEEKKRPIELRMYPIYYTKTGVNYVQENCKAVQPFFFPELHNDFYQINPRQRLDCIIEKICQYHLGQGHKILIFENNREEVKLLAQRLYKSLLQSKSVCAWISENECRRYIREKTGISNDDDLYGIMGEDDYKAFSVGISYHNADVPPSLRELVESEILKKNGHLKIVCSTETLAYGLNSNVDVVIIPHMMKQDNEEQQNNRFLTSNEFMNYAGRAGRLRPDIDGKPIGYIYPILKSKYDPIGHCGNYGKDQGKLWEELLETSKNPPVISSLYFAVDPAKRTFYLLSLFPNYKSDSLPYNSITAKWMKDILQIIPRISSEDFFEKRYILDQLTELIRRKLIYCTNDSDDEDGDFDPEYRLTDVGRNLSGYIIDLDDYDALMEIACNCVTDIGLYRVDLLKGIIETGEMLQNAIQSIGNISYVYEAELKKVIECMNKIFKKNEREMSEELKGQIRLDINNFEKYVKHKEYLCVAKNENFISLRFLAALLMWRDEQCTAKQMYQNLFISYTQMRRFAEQVSYRLDIVRYALPVAQVGTEQSLYKKIGHERILDFQCKIEELSEEVFYQIPAHICRFLSVQCCDPHTALQLRSVAKTYNYLEQIENSTGTKKNIEKIKIAEKIREWPEEWKEAFYNRFGGIVNEGN